jgi:transaldolase
MAMHALLQLITCGQSYWLDNLTRRKITSGELHERVTKQGLRGVTSNPAIFEKAISGGADYQAQIQQLVRAGCEVHDIYESLVVSDIQNACDILRPVYDTTDGEDGFVSLEVSPHLAHDTAGTMAEARRLWNAVARPNVCIKVPGTAAGVPAIEAMLYEGIHSCPLKLRPSSGVDWIVCEPRAGASSLAADLRPTADGASWDLYQSA